MELLKKLVEKCFPGAVFYKGWHVADMREGWIARRFGENEIFLGHTIKDAILAIKNRLEA